MNIEKQNTALALIEGYIDIRMSERWEVTDGPDDPVVLMGWMFNTKCRIPNYTEDLNAIHKVEKCLDKEEYSKGWSSNPLDHAPMMYLHHLSEVCGLETKEELVVSVNAEDKDKLNKRLAPYPSPIVMPPSAIILSHQIPANGYELCLIRATAAQKSEALLKTFNKWETT
jgi:hypothetical protein